jgi:hypothetical protein
MLPKNQFKQPFEFLAVAFTYQLSNAQTITRVFGVLEDGMEHHVQAPFGAFYFLGALPRGLDLGTPPFDPLSDKRR